MKSLVQNLNLRHISNKMFFVFLAVFARLCFQSFKKVIRKIFTRIQNVDQKSQNLMLILNLVKKLQLLFYANIFFATFTQIRNQHQNLLFLRPKLIFVWKKKKDFSHISTFYKLYNQPHMKRLEKTVYIFCGRNQNNLYFPCPGPDHQVP